MMKSRLNTRIKDLHQEHRLGEAEFSDPTAQQNYQNPVTYPSKTRSRLLRLEERPRLYLWTQDPLSREVRCPSEGSISHQDPRPHRLLSPQHHRLLTQLKREKAVHWVEGPNCPSRQGFQAKVIDYPRPNYSQGRRSAFQWGLTPTDCEPMLSSECASWLSEAHKRDRAGRQ